MPIGVNERNKIDTTLTTPIGVNRRHKIDAITIISISTLPFSQINICFVKFLFYALTVDMVSHWYLYLMCISLPTVCLFNDTIFVITRLYQLCHDELCIAYIYSSTCIVRHW